jgi:hypothetical protein
MSNVKQFGQEEVKPSAAPEIVADGCMVNATPAGILFTAFSVLIPLEDGRCLVARTPEEVRPLLHLRLPIENAELLAHQLFATIEQYRAASRLAAQSRAN